MSHLEGYRIPLDPSLPLVASQAFASGDHAFRAGDPVDWRALGLSEFDVTIWWRYGLVDHSPVDRDAKLNELTKISEEFGGYADEMANTADAASDAVTETVDAVRRVLDEPPGSKVTLVAVTPGETVSVRTPEQRRGKRR